MTSGAAVRRPQGRDDDLAEMDLDPARPGPGCSLDLPPILEDVLLNRRHDQQDEGA
jgi:hypothetical protein